MHDAVIDLRSDTLSMPTEEMLQSVQTAALGDDSRDGGGRATQDAKAEGEGILIK